MLRGLLETDLARDQDLRARAARRDRHHRDAGGRVRRRRAACSARPRAAARLADSERSCRGRFPVFAAMLIAISAVLSLVTIISIYREGGILKRLRATPLRPQTILDRPRAREAAAHAPSRWR